MSTSRRRAALERIAHSEDPQVTTHDRALELLSELDRREPSKPQTRPTDEELEEEQRKLERTFELACELGLFQPLIEARASRIAAERLPDAQLVTIPGEDHVSAFARRDKVLPHVTAFLDRVSEIAAAAA